MMALRRSKNTNIFSNKLILLLILVLLVTAHAFSFGKELKKIGNKAKDESNNIKDKAKELGNKAGDTAKGLKDKVNDKVVKNIMNTVGNVGDKIKDEFNAIKGNLSAEELKKKENQIVEQIAEKSVSEMEKKIKEDFQKAISASILDETQCKLIYSSFK